MSFRYRLLIIIPLVIIFVISGPALILYGEGYRYDWQNKRLSKTGNFYVDSTPRDATILINDQSPVEPWYQKIFIHKKMLGLAKVSGTTPTAVSNLIPNKYNLVVQKDGYRLWQKSLEILPEQTTNTGRIYLFLQDISPELVLAEKISYLLPTDNGKQIFYSIYDAGAKISEIKIIRPEQPKPAAELITKIKGKVSSLEKNNNYLAVKSDTGLYLINLDDATKTILINNLVSSPQKISLFNNIFYVQSNKKIYALDPNTQKVNLFFDLANISPTRSQLKDWFIGKDAIFLIKKIDGDIYLDKINLAISAEKYTKQSIVYSLSLPNYLFAINPQQLNDDLMILTANQEFFIIDPSQKTNYIIARNPAKKIIVQPEAKNILAYNDFEISLYAINKKNDLWQIKNDLINRSSNQVNQVLWRTGNNYILNADKNNNLMAIELDGRDSRNIYNLFRFDNLQTIWNNANPNLVYVLGKIGEQSGIWRLKLQ
ncbi:MAG: hypothetical protein PHV78_02800 [Patescibacteria group bacterium]|nr:hypothetical protein [Patescibacteria group bacterium]MDD5121684.1 hypothetical protein [Patescibacteria group bacterium]MDD5222085.1 hypothetical protein [Patescibacteria group bacterium]MDD5396152.1 hypothetical protein [Patescibacteria group bacterium]